MKNIPFADSLEAIRLSRLDVIAFVGAFLSGLSLYVLLHLLFHLHQAIVSIAIIGTMVAYAAVVVGVPRLRVRLDQAGDNAYYLGLLFTLVSMAFALYEFGTALTVETGRVPLRSGPQQIIANFGVALASTITGIFLRVFLHQIRVDPSDVEGMTRIELAEASKRVRASLDTVTSDLALFHDEVRQRCTDVLTTLIEEAKRSVEGMNCELESATKEMLDSVASGQRNVLENTQVLTQHLTEIATDAVAAIGRLRAVEPPPLTLSKRLDRVSTVLEAAGNQTERVISHLEGTSQAGSAAMQELSTAASALGRLTQEMNGTHRLAIERIANTTETVSAALTTINQRLEREGTLLVHLEQQSRRSVEESVRAQTAAIEVLTRLTELTRGLTSALKQGEAPAGHGTTR